MNRLVIMVFALLLSAACAQDKAKDGIVLKRGMFSRELNMLDAERDEYASYLAAQAANQLAAGQDQAAQVKAARLLSLAQTLSPRNKRTQVVIAQAGQGGKPKPVEHAYSPASLSRLLLTRGKLLVEEKDAESHWLGRAFIEIAAGLDPKNQQAVKESGNMEFDFGVLDWAVLENGK